MDRALVTDGTIAQSETQRAALWHIRETIPEANRRIGAVSSHDISLPLSAIPAFIATAPATLARIDTFRINCFGHLGDGNLHYNVFPGRAAAAPTTITSAARSRPPSTTSSTPPEAPSPPNTASAA